MRGWWSAPCPTRMRFIILPRRWRSLLPLLILVLILRSIWGARLMCWMPPAAQGTGLLFFLPQPTRYMVIWVLGFRSSAANAMQYQDTKVHRNLSRSISTLLMDVPRAQRISMSATSVAFIVCLRLSFVCPVLPARGSLARKTRDG